PRPPPGGCRRSGCRCGRPSRSRCCWWSCRPRRRYIRCLRRASPRSRRVLRGWLAWGSPRSSCASARAGATTRHTPRYCAPGTNTIQYATSAIHTSSDDMPITRLCLVRHGETEWNAEGRVQGQTDIPLSAYGLAQAEAAAQVLGGQDFSAVYSSDLLRVRQTAEPSVRRLALPLQLDPAL